MTKPITLSTIKSLSSTIVPTDTSRNLAERSVTTNGIHAASENNALSATNTTTFSDEIETGSATDQKQSGRCWLFATLNIIRSQIAKDFKIDDFELSQSYSYFWDKLERANTFYERVIETAGSSLEEHEMIRLLKYPQEDGGWWEYSASLITKYGIVPKSAMPESVSTSKSYELNTVLNRKLRKDALALRTAISEGTANKKIEETKQSMMAEVYRMLTIAIGTPPQKFDFIYRDKDKKYHRVNDMTPIKFLQKYAEFDPNNYISLVNDPSPAKVYEQSYIFKHGGNVIDGIAPVFLNVDMETIKKLTLQHIKKGEAVWFACDVDKDSNKKGYMSTDTHDIGGTFGVDFTFSKADRLLMRDASVSHAVTITGVDLKEGVPVQWKIENSWGTDVGQKGYYTMSSDWFDEHGYVVVVRRDLLSAKLQAALKKKPIVMPDWDPLNMHLPGSLA